MLILQQLLAFYLRFLRLLNENTFIPTYRPCVFFCRMIFLLSVSSENLILFFYNGNCRIGTFISVCFVSNTHRSRELFDPCLHRHPFLGSQFGNKFNQAHRLLVVNRIPKIEADFIEDIIIHMYNIRRILLFISKVYTLYDKTMSS